MEWVKRQNDGDGDAYAVLREIDWDLDKPEAILPGWAARRFDCSTAYEPALFAVQTGDLDLARRIIAEAGVYDSREAPPDWCYE